MGNFFQKALNTLSGKDEMRILMVGLDAACFTIFSNSDNAKRKYLFLYSILQFYINLNWVKL